MPLDHEFTAAVELPGTDPRPTPPNDNRHGGCNAAKPGGVKVIVVGRRAAEVVSVAESADATADVTLVGNATRPAGAVRLP